MEKTPYVQVSGLIKAILAAQGRAAQSVSRELGREASYIRSASRAGRVPSVATVADIADAAGADLVVVDRVTGEAVAIVVPPRRAEAAGRDL